MQMLSHVSRRFMQMKLGVSSGIIFVLHHSYFITWGGLTAACGRSHNPIARSPHQPPTPDTTPALSLPISRSGEGIRCPSSSQMTVLRDEACARKRSLGIGNEIRDATRANDRKWETLLLFTCVFHAFNQLQSHLSSPLPVFLLVDKLIMG
jgi:hypothetical protein